MSEARSEDRTWSKEIPFKRLNNTNKTSHFIPSTSDQHFIEYNVLYRTLGNETSTFRVNGKLCASAHLAALFQFLLHLLSWQVHIDGEVWRQELTDADVFNLIVVLHACKPQSRENTEPSGTDV